MSLRPCPLCGASLSAWGEAKANDKHNLVAECPSCGPYVLPAEVIDLLPFTEAVDRANASLEVRQRQATSGAMGVRVRPEDFVHVHDWKSTPQ